MSRLCSVGGCHNRHLAQGLCNKHYKRLWITPEWSAWSSIKTRCYNKNSNTYHKYGGRGIKMCDEWLNSFQAFHDYVGDKPSLAHSIDRIDNNGNYEPGNVRWATGSQQILNQRVRRNSKTGITGVTINPACKNKYLAYLAFNGKVRLFHHYKTISEAITARKNMEHQIKLETGEVS